MTLDEAKKVARIVETAEGGCAGCMNEATAELNATFTEYTWELITPPPNPIWPLPYHPSIEVKLRPKAQPAPAYRSVRCG